MDVKEENICRLCLNIVHNEFEVVDATVREMFKFLSIKLNLEISKDPVLCIDCMETVKVSYNFKSACVNHETRCLSSTIDKQVDTFEMVYGNEECEDTEGAISADFGRCQFCTNRCEQNNLVPLDTLLDENMCRKFLSKLVPKMDFHVGKNLVTCASCKHSLNLYFKMLLNSSSTEEKLDSYCQEAQTSNMEQIKLSIIQRSSCKDNSDIKPEVEKVVYIKDEEINLNQQHSTFKIDYRGETCDFKSNDEDMTQHMLTQKQISAGEMFETETQQNTTEYDTDEETCDALIHEDSSTVKMYKCEYCTYETRSKYYIKKHKSLHEKSGQVKLYHCASCPFVTKIKHSLRCHVMRHKSISEVELYECEFCTYKSREKNLLNKHTLIHKDKSEVQIYKCALCPYETKRRQNLVSHVRSHDNVSQMHKCALCTFEAKHARYLKLHMLVHKDISEIETYKCTMCKYESKRLTGLKKHLVTHADASKRPVYKCTICEYEAISKSCIDNHMLGHKDPSELEVFKCVPCNYETFNRKYLKKHMGTKTHYNMTTGLTKME